MENLKKVIEAILKEEIKTGLYFDAHTIICILIQQHSDEYLTAFKNSNYSDTKTYHSAISKAVKSFSALVEDTNTDCYSRQIHDDFGVNSLYKRI